MLNYNIHIKDFYEGMKKTGTISDEDLQYLRDLAEKDYIEKYRDVKLKEKAI